MKFTKKTAEIIINTIVVCSFMYFAHKLLIADISELPTIRLIFFSIVLAITFVATAGIAVYYFNKWYDKLPNE